VCVCVYRPAAQRPRAPTELLPVSMRWGGLVATRRSEGLWHTAGTRDSSLSTHADAQCCLTNPDSRRRQPDAPSGRADDLATAVHPRSPATGRHGLPRRPRVSSSHYPHRARLCPRPSAPPWPAPALIALPGGDGTRRRRRIFPAEQARRAVAPASPPRCIVAPAAPVGRRWRHRPRGV